MGGYPAGEGTQVGQKKEYSLHGGRYASSVHAGELSCYDYSFEFWQLSDVLMKRLDEQEEEIRTMTFERDEVKKELQTSMSKAKDIELNSSFLMEENGK